MTLPENAVDLAERTAILASRAEAIFFDIFFLRETVVSQGSLPRRRLDLGSGWLFLSPAAERCDAVRSSWDGPAAVETRAAEQGRRDLRSVCTRSAPSASSCSGSHWVSGLSAGWVSTRAVRVASLGEETPQQQPQAPDWDEDLVCVRIIRATPRSRL